MEKPAATAADPSTGHPLWLTAQEWLDSPYHKQWNPDGKFTVLFDIGRNQSGCKVFPIYPAAELMIRVQDGWCYQPYGCRCESTKSDSSWVYVEVTDFSHDLNLKSIREHIEKELTYYKYSIYNWSCRKFLEELGIDLNLTTANGEPSYRGSVTHQELQRILEVPKLREVWEKSQDKAMKNLSWYKESPSKETPIRVYAAGHDDASYTKLYETLGQAIQDVERFKVEGMPERPESEGWIFTN